MYVCVRVIINHFNLQDDDFEKRASRDAPPNPSQPHPIIGPAARGYQSVGFVPPSDRSKHA